RRDHRLAAAEIVENLVLQEDLEELARRQRQHAGIRRGQKMRNDVLRLNPYEQHVAESVLFAPGLDLRLTLAVADEDKLDVAPVAKHPCGLENRSDVVIANTKSARIDDFECVGIQAQCCEVRTRTRLREHLARPA